ncbi:aspartic peptidase domain-containing protein [Hyaloscypha finlandica]|nr:aspartic peptidase domain-containing protein [Hyaloscypha finlandica]
MQLQMGLANSTTRDVGVMGIGYDANEATQNYYHNFMDEMVSDGLTNTKLYSLWLNDLGSSSGSILFGGIDTEKYYGTLSSIPINKDGNGPYLSRFPVSRAQFIPESSTVYMYLPQENVDVIYSVFGVEIGLDKSPYIDCKYNNSSYLSFGFESGTVISVPYSEFVSKLFVPSLNPGNLTFSNICSFGIASTIGGDNLLGDFFLRSAYVVYDLTNNHIWMAPAVLNTTESNIVEIQAGALSLPQTTGVARPSPTASTSPSGTSLIGTSTNSSPVQTGTPKKNNHAVAIGVGVAVPLGVALAALIGFCFWWRGRKTSQSTSEKLPASQDQPVQLLELGDSTYIHADPVYIDNGQGRMSRISSTPSELSAGQTPISSPRPPVERKPVPMRDKLPTTWEQS